MGMRRPNDKRTALILIAHKINLILFEFLFSILKQFNVMWMRELNNFLDVCFGESRFTYIHIRKCVWLNKYDWFRLHLFYIKTICQLKYISLESIQYTLPQNNLMAYICICVTIITTKNAIHRE